MNNLMGVFVLTTLLSIMIGFSISAKYQYKIADLRNNIKHKDSLIAERDSFALLQQEEIVELKRLNGLIP